MTELEEIYLEKKNALFALALSVTKNRAEAEDAVHEAVMKTARRNPENNYLKAYLFTAVRNCSIDILRRRRPSMEINESIFADKEAGPDTNLKTKESHFIVKKLLESLPPKQQEVIIMKIYSGLTFDEIAKVLDEPLPTVSSRYRRCLKSLKSSLEKLV